MPKAMREPTFWILTALAGGTQHGYGVIQQVSHLTGGQVTLLAGTLYAALDRLAVEGLVEIDREEVVDGRTRRYYRLSSGGRAALTDETERLQRNAKTARQQLYGPSTAPAREGLNPA
ncbi:putative PadR-like family transcriptional regulator [Actinoplanes missouriensis 431]|uniref:Putative PadR-like family transcriptional regulator n=1 Tax=Actinoplanes missouriensis (strain ATCC 14538 / DSM 43046 / CBS 188.64 / JCM 3121 / NBRC 102363 / NCIMB 12654 / NRRL B-3342 / UNCC 431) TaxID=512565 RepID=I0HJI9_ACTM4|nr:PadR family transcriptional regulator [Actinoplanes missouriensis]BAL93176.1 putative PadR-like family transcriptional regulator [Actinoplanes missouriensis 431]